MDSTDSKVKLKEGKKKNRYLDLARELKKTMKHESDGDTHCALGKKKTPKIL